jgi:hypothetical protein
MKKGTRIGLRIVGLLAGIALLIGLGVAVYFRINSPHFFRIARDIEKATVRTALEELDGAILIEGMHACENLYLEQETMRVYVADLGGHIHLLDGESREQLEIVKSLDTYLLPTSWVCPLTSSQVAARSCSRCQPRQRVVTPGSPSDLRPRKPPS